MQIHHTSNPDASKPESLMPRGVATSLPSPSPSLSLVHSASSPKANIVPLEGSNMLELPPETILVLSPPESYMAEDSKESPSDSSNEKGSNTMTGETFNKPPDDEDAVPTMELSPESGVKEQTEGMRGKKRTALESSSANEPSQPKRARVVGLKNLGNTCYNNAVIQALSHTTPLREYFLDRNIQPEAKNTNNASNQEDVAIQVQLHTARPRTRRAAQLEGERSAPADVNLCNEFSKLLRSMWASDDASSNQNLGGSSTSKTRRASSRLASVVSPHAFARAVATLLPLFQERYEQQDAQEFLRCALERMQEELIMERIEAGAGSVDHIRKAEDTIVKRVFGGILWNKISCLSCKEYTVKPDPFLDLSLVIPDPISTTSGGSTIAEKISKAVTLEDCIDLFSSSEELEMSSTESDSSSSFVSQSNRSCLGCGSDSGFSKAFKLGELPRILCIHLKRFRWKRNTARGSKQKVDTLVKFPLDNLDMGRWLSDHETHDGNSLYELYAVVVHQGSGANSGHYTAFVKDHDDWWNLNDERASRAQPDVVLRAKAYLLFYKQKQLQPDVPVS